MENIENQNCPICGKELRFNPRHPKYVCSNCAKLATDKAGRKLQFFNYSLSGGFKAVYDDTKAVYDCNVCFINGIECWADEARFGGIVIEMK